MTVLGIIIRLILRWVVMPRLSEEAQAQVRKGLRIWATIRWGWRLTKAALVVGALWALIACVF